MPTQASTSTTTLASFGTPQSHYPYQPRSGTHTRQPSTVGHDSIKVISQPNYTANHASETHFLYDAKDPEADDFMHNPGQHDAIVERRSCSLISIRGLLNVVALVTIMLALIGLFAAYPIIQEIYSRRLSYMGGFGLGGTNSSGQVPRIPNMPGLIDSHTPERYFKRKGFDGYDYNLVFSDEFEIDGRSFYPGDDPYWEAVDLHYWGTGDYEWNDPQAITTKDGYLEITMSKERTHNLDYQGGMLQSWNKLCFTGGYIEVSVSLPGSPQIAGFWPGVWTMGNLARAGYGATTEGVWPFSYNSCDVGTVKNQTINGQPAAAAGLSYQPGQRVSACTCKGGDHPGPNVRVGRGAPEIDIIEAQNYYAAGGMQGEVWQSAQIAPYDNNYEWKQSSPASTIYNSDLTKYNPYLGGSLQEAISGVTALEDEGYEVNGGFRKYGFEYRPGGDDDAFITWMYNEKPTWKITAATFPPDSVTQVSQRLVSEEPMSMIFNFHMSDSFQHVDIANLPFPSKLRIDYVRIYQREGEVNLSCDPKDRPTADYINDHLDAYMNPNLTTWEEAGFTFPKNRLVDDC
ncbi:glycoside hydrolase family 16 protein [Cystobasidium minutum MCA 4210]|uniref:glycoside hydrolase family 16 protein n=1 Tax=Cystobasidium minutum MCA 4210 TaxID=1397322 RepID=UPI0034CDC28B|eukprot:jgi/Rhomi1/139385/e_gw1.1.1015.1